MTRVRLRDVAKRELRDLVTRYREIDSELADRLNFPYRIVFKRLPDRISVLGIQHFRQEPIDWTSVEP